MVNIPKEISAGLSAEFRCSFSEYPASSWVATLFLRGASSKADVVAAADGDQFVFTLSAVVTSGLVDGLYTAVVRVEKDGDVHQPVSQRLTVLPDVTKLDTHDPRTAVEISLAAVQNTIAGRATSDQLKMSFNGRSLEKTSVLDLLTLEASYLKKLGAERRKKSGAGLLQINKVGMK